MKTSNIFAQAALWLAFSLLLSGCSRKPQPPADSDPTRSGQQTQGQTGTQRGAVTDEALDEAGRIMAETIKRHASPSGTPRTPAEIAQGATPTPPLGTQLGVTGQPFTSFEGRFIVTPPPGFPPFTQSVKNSDLPNGASLEIHDFIAEKQGGDAIDIKFLDLSESADTSSPQRILEGMRDGSLKPYSSTLEKQEFLTIHGYPAIAFFFTVAKGSGGPLYVRELAIIKQRRLYALIYVSYDRAVVDGPEVQAFFNSLVLLD